MATLLPTVYQPPSRQGRGRQLNTIAEHHDEMNHGFTSESEGTASDDTVIGKPVYFLEPKQYTRSLRQQQPRINTYTRGPPSVVSDDEEDEEQEASSPRNSYAGSDAGTVFSESCPSLTGSHVSEATSFATESSRNSVASRNSRNRYPSLLIPRGSWAGYEGDIKQMPFGMSPSTKVRLSPEALERLPRHIPALEATPSLGDASSVRSESPHPSAMNSLPQTPDLHNLEIVEGQMWGGHQQLTLDTPLEIAIDEHHSILLSPEEAHSTPYSATRSTYSATYSAISRSSRSTTRSASRLSSLNDLVCQFPEVPGATPTEHTPITPSIAVFDSAGVRLPAQAFEMLQNLSKQQYPESIAEASEKEEEEMQECGVTDLRRRSWAEKSPCSEYSISQLSIPSPGGFFASLKTGARNTWCTPSRKTSPPPPSSTTAENFYNTPWTKPTEVKETIIEYANVEDEEGPPTVKQATFALPSQVPKESEDLYGNGQEVSTSFEYEESYEDGIIEKAGASMDRTNNWLAAQTSYLSVLRETNPANDPADYPPTPSLQSEEFDLKQTIENETQTAERFLQEAKAAVMPEVEAAAPIKEALFLEAFNYQKTETKRSDAFLHASSRLDSVQSTRITQPKRHVQSLLNNHTSKTLEPDHARPKYRGPFSQNPRNTVDLSRTEEQDDFHMLERQQTALNAIKPSLWSLEAQRAILSNGRLMANSAASERLTTKDADADAIQFEQPQKPNKKRPRVLDLGGAATASWAWAAASKWPNAKVITAQTAQQAELALQYPSSEETDVEAYRPETPSNHQVMTVPCFWQLPFRDNYFDVISARTLHMYLRAHPVADNDSINEWDLTLKECMRVLKPGGVLDFFVMDSGITNSAPVKDLRALNLSPSNMTASNSLPTPIFKPRLDDVATEFKTELLRRGYEADGGCGRLMSRLKQEGFVGVKRQWIGLPMGCAEAASVAPRSSKRNTVSTTISSLSSVNSQSPPRKPAFRPAPRPVSNMSLVSRIIDQYADVEGPSGSTNDVSDMSALLGELLWEEWLVRLRIESGRFSPENILDGIDEQFGDWRRSGQAAWRGVIGWARKPTKKELAAAADGRSSIVENNATIPAHGLNHGFMIETPLPTPANLPVAATSTCAAPQPMCYSAPVGIPRPATTSIRRQASIRRAKMVGSVSAIEGLRIDTNTLRRSGTTNWDRRVNEVRLEDFTLSAVDRGEVGMIPMVIMQ